MLRAAISGNVKQIPCLLERKQARNRVIQNSNLTSIIDTKNIKVASDMLCVAIDVEGPQKSF